ncbi:MAG: hypothetical protein M1837_001327 [Sclerophora amabilis]|nr:MAG: hypothetical protein M1837_001327 [Sclerophora amabilis]
MASPITFPGPPSAPTPGADAGGREGDEGTMNGVSVRPMRLKVLYTFDDQNKTNCLARWPHVMNIQTVYLDEATPIGVIELKTCIQAIVSASPELVAKLGQDYTVYAFDYSEYETPLVGQGMLSWALASASPTPGAPAHQSRTVITGRVCKNILGLFSNGVKETLEVKLRLVPVPTCLQSEYLNSMDKYRELSKVMPTGFDASAWTAYLQANPTLGALAGKLEARATDSELAQTPGAGSEFLSQLLSPADFSGCPPQEPSVLAEPPGENTESQEAPSEEHLHRSASPRASSHTAVVQHPDTQERPSRAPSRASKKKPNPKSDGRAESQNGIGSVSHEEGPAKKRARLTKAKWSGKNSMGTDGGPLRVAASTAASMRLHRPIATYPSKSRQGSIAELPRAPTPRPLMTNKLPTPHLERGGVRNESLETNNAGAPSVPHSYEVHQSVESTLPSLMNEDYNSPSNTPINIASSPPIIQDMPSVPSSPNLPALRPDVDSGFMSGTMDDLFENDDEMRPVDDEDLAVAAGYSRRDGPQSSKDFTIEQENPGPTNLLPTKMLPRPVTNRAKSIAGANSIASSDAAGSPEDGNNGPPANKRKQHGSNQSSRPRPRLKTQTTAPAVSSAQPPPSDRPVKPPSAAGSLTLPPVPNSDPVLFPPGLQRSQTWSGADFPTSDAPEAAQSGECKGGKRSATNTQPRKRTGEQRKQAIQRRLETAIQSGEMPPYCENCGAIETPTWRKAWVKVVDGTPDQVRVSDDEGGIIATVQQVKGEDGLPSFSILKRSLLEDDEGFTEIQLCNPCGLWLSKFRCMRPQEKWYKEPRDHNEKKKKPYRKRKQSNPAGNDTSEANPAPVSSAPREGASPSDADELPQDGVQEEFPKAPPRGKTRASSVQPQKHDFGVKESWNDASAASALRRAIQSSPARLIGTAYSPINIDADDLGPTRRTLFSTPKKSDLPRVLQDISSSGNQSQGAGTQPHSSGKSTGSIDQGDKENCPPTADEDELMRLFEDDGQVGVTTPTRMSPMDQPLVTPAKTTPHKQVSPWKMGLFSPNRHDPLLPPRTPSTRNSSTKSGSGSAAAKPSPFTAHFQQILSEANLSPSTHNFDFPSLEGLLPPNSFSNMSPSKNSILNLPDFDPEDVFSTDVPMPSSPPPFFSLYEDPAEPGSGLWSDYNAPTSPNKQIDVDSLDLEEFPNPKWRFDEDNEESNQRNSNETETEIETAPPASDKSRNNLETGITVDGSGCASLTVDFSTLIEDARTDKTSPKTQRKGTGKGKGKEIELGSQKGEAVQV